MIKFIYLRKLHVENMFLKVYFEKHIADRPRSVFLFQLERNVKIRGFSSLCAYPLFSVMRYLLYF